MEVRQRLKFLNDVGLHYITLDRFRRLCPAERRSGFSLQRASGSRLVGACYVLDEPSIGLHARDTARLVRILEELRDLGNTIIVVEHDPDVMRSADHIIEWALAQGSTAAMSCFPDLIRRCLSDGAQSLTSRYLQGRADGRDVNRRRKLNPKRF